MKIIFRADASVAIGTGHVMRCLTLAGRLRELGGDAVFVCREHPGNLCDYIIKSGFRVLRLPACAKGEYGEETNPLPHAAWLGSDQRSDALAALQALAGIGKADWIIVDHYALDERWESLLRPYTGKIMVIDDIADRVHDCDILLDQNLYADMDGRYRKLAPDTCVQLLGPHYALLRREFNTARQKLPARDGGVKRILVFMGGADADNATALVLEALRLLHRPDIKIDVVVGGSNPHLNAIKRRCGEMVNTYCHIQIENLADLMLAADFAIGAGGVSTWERCALGLPSLVISVAANQTAIAMEAANQGAAFFAGELIKIDKHRLAELLGAKLADRAALQAMSQCACRLVDGKGTERVAQQIINL